MKNAEWVGDVEVSKVLGTLLLGEDGVICVKNSRDGSMRKNPCVACENAGRRQRCGLDQGNREVVHDFS
jgi:hypothetical protein